MKQYLFQYWLKIIFIFFALIISSNIKGQTSRTEKRDSLDALLDNNVKNRTITTIILDSLLIDHMYQISGTNIKDGKSAASAATIDEKGATVNLSFKPFKRMFFIQPTVAASSSNGFADVFSSGQYNRVLSGGINIQQFCYSKIKFPNDTYVTEKRKLHNMLRVQRRKYRNLVNGRSNPWQTEIDSTILIFRQNSVLLSRIGMDPALTESESLNGGAEIIILFYTYVRKLIDKKVLGKDAIKLTPVAIYSKLSAMNNTVIENLLWDEMLTITDSLQYHIDATKVIKWFSYGINYNNQPQPILDTIKKGKTRNFYNEYITGKIAYNLLHLKSSGSGYYISPNFTFSNTRDFKDADKKTANFVSQISIGGTPVERIDSSVTYFEKVAERKFVWAFELPVLWYWKNSKLGLDAAIHFGGNDPKGDNVGGRIGLYVPVGTKGESALTIEPLLRVKNLFENSTNRFFRDNVAFGFNVSVSIPAFFGGK